MATLIRIKRRLGDEPLETILVRPKRRRLGSGADGGVDKGADSRVDKEADVGVDAPLHLPPAVLERVATVDSKDTGVDPCLLKEIRRGWELKETYKRLGPSEGWREARRRQARERGKEKRYLLTASLRGDATTTTVADDSKTATAAKEATSSSSSNSSSRKIVQPEIEEKIQYYDTQISSLHNAQEDVITCNGQPMEVEKYVYDIYYYPDSVDHTDLVCEQNRLMADEEDEDEDEEEEDENAESYWRNEYPEEEDDDEEEEDMEEFDYMQQPTRRQGLHRCGLDESFDVDDYEEEDGEEDYLSFDEHGNIVLDPVVKLGHCLAVTELDSSEESE